MEIKVDNLTAPDVICLLNEHHQSMFFHSPPESIHALDLDALRKPDITMWSLRIDKKLAGCGALKELDSQQGEIKSMRTVSAFLRKGVATQLLKAIVDESQRRRYAKLWLETGSMAVFQPAINLYLKFGFRYCEPFADYEADPNSVFMMKSLSSRPLPFEP